MTRRWYEDVLSKLRCAGSAAEVLTRTCRTTIATDFSTDAWSSRREYCRGRS